MEEVKREIAAAAEDRWDGRPPDPLMNWKLIRN